MGLTVVAAAVDDDNRLCEVYIRHQSCSDMSCCFGSIGYRSIADIHPVLSSFRCVDSVVVSLVAVAAVAVELAVALE